MWDDIGTRQGDPVQTSWSENGAKRAWSRDRKRWEGWITGTGNRVFLMSTGRQPEASFLGLGVLERCLNFIITAQKKKMEVFYSWRRM